MGFWGRLGAFIEAAYDDLDTNCRYHVAHRAGGISPTLLGMAFLIIALKELAILILIW